MEDKANIKITWKSITGAVASGAAEMLSSTLLVAFFALFNLCGLAYIFYYGIRYHDASWSLLASLSVAVALAVGFVVWAGHKAYRFALTKMLRKAYDRTAPKRTELCLEAIHRTGEIWRRETLQSNKPVATAIQWGQLAHSYYQHLPYFFQSLINQLLMRVPIADLLLQVKQDITAGNAETAADKLRISIDGFVQDRFFSQNNLMWLLWLIPLNALALWAILYWLKH